MSNTITGYAVVQSISEAGGFFFVGFVSTQFLVRSWSRSKLVPCHMRHTVEEPNYF